MFRLILIRILCLLCLLIVSAAFHTLHAQISESQARELLAQRNIPEDTLRARLLKKGYDVDNLKPSQVQDFQRVLLETVNEIEAERALAEKSSKVVTPPVDVTVAPKPAEKPAESTPIVPAEVLPPKLGIYGQEIFHNNSIAVYKTSSEAIVPDDYILDTGDEIGIIGFGKSQFDQKLTVSQEGFVTLGPGLPKVLLKGLKWKEAKEVLYQRYSLYNSIGRNEFQATLIQPRNMTVNVFGEAKTTGSITLPGINNAFNVITAAGGPTDIGSVRNIKIIRGKQVIPVDVYKFMSDPSVATNAYLLNNDYIHIPIAQKVVTITGAVVRPMQYELLEDENLLQLIQYAGGTKPDAYLLDVQITRFMNDRKIITDVNLRELMEHGGDYILVNGDMVTIKTLDSGTGSYVTILGEVSFPGNFEIKEGKRISDLVNQAVLKPGARLDYAYLLMHQPDGTFKYERINLQEILNNPKTAVDLELHNQDVVQVMPLSTYVEKGTFSIEGAVNQPNVFPFNPEGQLKLEDALLLAGGLKKEAADKGFVIRHDPHEPKTLQYLNVDFKKAMTEPGSDANIDIHSGDVIRVMDKTNQRDEIFVTISGAVRYPGQYAFGPNLTVVDLVNLAGGVVYGADSSRIDIARANLEQGKDVNVTQITTSLFDSSTGKNTSIVLEPFDQVYVRSIPEFELQEIVTITGEVKYPGNYALVKDKERIYDLIERAGGITGGAFPEGAKLFRSNDNTGLVVIDLKSILQNQNVPSNIVMREGDVLQIPKSHDLVTIEGFVNLDEAYSPSFLEGQGSISVAYRGDKSAKYYIDNFAAGISDRGLASKIKVQYADGRVEKTKKFLFFNDYPDAAKGSHIIVGAKPIKPLKTKEQTKTDWSGVLRDTMAQATAVLTLLILGRSTVQLGITYSFAIFSLSLWQNSVTIHNQWPRSAISI
jgi:protein involved in polysaccharide export with SLBB domain